MGSTISVILRIRNSTKHDITSVTAYDIDNFDFGHSKRPDLVLNGLSVPAGRCLERLLEINSLASNCPFAMKMSFADGTSDAFKINAKCAYDSTEPNLRHLARAHSIRCRRPGPRILEVEVTHTLEQREDQKALRLMEEGDVLMAVGRFEDASIKLLEAAQYANQEDTKAAIRRTRLRLDSVKGNDIDQKATAVAEEGLQLFHEHKYQLASRKFEEALRIARNPDTVTQIGVHLRQAREAKDNQEAKMLNQEGLLLRKSDQNDRALLKFDEALKMTRDPALVTSMKTNKAETLWREALATLDAAWLADTSSEAEQAIHKFAKAKFLLEEADSIRPKPRYKKLRDMVDVKVAGNKCHNTGLELEKEGSRLVDRTSNSVSLDDCRGAREKYEQARTQYREAKRRFEEGVGMGEDKFRFSVAMAESALDGVEAILEELGKAEEDITLNEER